MTFNGVDILSKLILVRHGQSQWNLENRFYRMGRCPFIR